MNTLPKAKNEDLVLQELNDEVLIYNLQTNKVLCLNKTAAVVYYACDGKTAAADLKRDHQLTDEIIFLALDGLAKENLLELGEADATRIAGPNRRQMIRKAGLATVIALPLISSVIAPAAATAASVSCIPYTAVCTPGLCCPDAPYCVPTNIFSNRCCKGTGGFGAFAPYGTASCNGFPPFCDAATFACPSSQCCSGEAVKNCFPGAGGSTTCTCTCV